MIKLVLMLPNKVGRRDLFKVLGILCLFYIWMRTCNTDDVCQTGGCRENIIEFHHTNFVNKSTKKVLVWTKFFFFDWAKHVGGRMSESKYNCSATSNRSELGSADAVLFHFIDLWFWETVPGFRRSDQVWVLYNMEAPPHHHFTGLTWTRSFNWTMSYRTDSTIYSPYGEFVPLTREEEDAAAVMYGNKDFSKHKTRMVFAVISDCQDDVQRYRYIQQLEKYVKIDYFGKCGNLTCPRTPEAECDSNKYRFRIAFENANCRDYITEKIWKSLQQESIPIVNWKAEQVGNIPKDSYINIHDFNGVKELADYLNMLSTNTKLYNEYFTWKTRYKLEIENMYAFKYLCDALHTPRKAQTIIDPNKWLRTDTCRTWSIKEVVRRHWDRFLFDLGW
ncbi:glycoprotein 3-alpha-L-fucosyltransferase A-like [Mizuhopecten yessoensis]|uniref:glycoprotein 3-alpha-L-fucosyltransferase A-like n=1 Tax=Mizuhopecten yessoensis TaxID=6573 RepID=UPI000B45A7CF|nr:glycoprotein 3-alpha-L-fucosyltransferase A-like [Mizuhopecten yessoensis]XP_021370106.1 glycoprotein 3-alpha-L-fucosyltransferase A-like [Mizuhopecten yessoensis]